MKFNQYQYTTQKSYLGLMGLLFILAFLGRLNGQSDFNLTLLSTINEHMTTDFPISYNDVWGYVDQNGKEYAILGTTTGTAIIDVSDPAKPKELTFISGATSVWRDMFHFGNYIYVTTDQGTDGLLIINMTNLENITHSFWKPMLSINGETIQLATCHNLFIDENGYCYLAGCNVNNGGYLILDLFTNPDIPAIVGQGPANYSHDIYVRGDTLWSSDIENDV